MRSVGAWERNGATLLQDADTMITAVEDLLNDVLGAYYSICTFSPHTVWFDYTVRFDFDARLCVCRMCVDGGGEGHAEALAYSRNQCKVVLFSLNRIDRPSTSLQDTEQSTCGFR
eukprot:1354814-Amorphochlora_amoeboformis.AAC.2